MYSESTSNKKVAPRALDLFCGAGGASAGLSTAGFEVWGVDRNSQPNWPIDRRPSLVAGDAIEFARTADLTGWDFIWASPPCQKFSAYRRKGYGVGSSAPNLIDAVRGLLRASGVPYVIENVPGAPLRDPITLCGSMFGLDVRRHRLFEFGNMPTPEAPACDHASQQAKGKRYPGATNRDGRYTCEVGVWRIPLAQQHAAMGGCEWMTREELSQAIPPAYSEWIGDKVLKHIRQG